MAEVDNGCRGKAWAGGAVTGLVVMAFLLAVGHLSFLAALFLGLVTFGLFGAFLVWAFCSGGTVASAQPAPAPAPVVDLPPVPTPAPKPAAPAVPEPKPAPAAAPAAAPTATVASAAPASLADIPLDFDTLQPHGCFIGSAAVMVVSDQDDLRGVVTNLMAFFADESCGQCTPCRVGTEKMLGMLERDEWDVAALRQLSQVMMDASICGLGQAAPNPVLGVLNHFTERLAAQGIRLVQEGAR